MKPVENVYEEVINGYGVGKALLGHVELAGMRTSKLMVLSMWSGTPWLEVITAASTQKEWLENRLRKEPELGCHLDGLCDEQGVEWRNILRFSDLDTI